MIFVLSVISVFVFISIYFFVRAEGLQREILIMKREVSGTKKENVEHLEVMATMAQRYEDLYKKRLADVREKEQLDNDLLTMVSPLINNYAMILNESIKGNQLSAVEKTFEGGEKGSYQKFINFIGQSEASVRHAWSKNSVIGYITLIEILLSGKADVR